MGAGVPSGLQNQFEALGASWVGSIPTYSRHKKTHIQKNVCFFMAGNYLDLSPISSINEFKFV